MIYGDYHMHTTFCDGRSTPEEMVLSAIDKGLTRMGFSMHAENFSSGRSIPRTPENFAEYRAEIYRLKEKYADRIEILCGVECDYSFRVNKEDFDYMIGSVHYLPTPDGIRPVDLNRATFMNTAKTYYDNDFYRMAEEYFALVSRIGEVEPDIIGHLDLLSKHNAGGCFFDEQHPRYLAAAYGAVDALLPLGIPFEINMGVVARGYRDHPYPADPILQYIFKQGGKVILDSDSHSPQHIAHEFDKWEQIVPKENWYDHTLIGKK